MKKILSIASVVLLGLFVSVNCLAKDGWMTNFAKAQKKAQQEKKLMLVDFTGSDWCPWCMKLENEVFSKDVFKKFAAKNLVLVFLDFPRSKSQSAAIKMQNSALSQKYGIRGFPTVLLLDSNGKVVARTGYRRGGAENYVKYLKELMGKK